MRHLDHIVTTALIIEFREIPMDHLTIQPSLLGQGSVNGALSKM